MSDFNPSDINKNSSISKQQRRCTNTYLPIASGRLPHPLVEGAQSYEAIRQASLQLDFMTTRHLEDPRQHEALGVLLNKFCSKSSQLINHLENGGQI